MEKPTKTAKLPSLRRVNNFLDSKLVHFKPLNSLCIEAVCKNLTLFTSREFARQVFHVSLLPNALWNELLPTFENNTKLRNLYKDRPPAELVEVLSLLMETAEHFDFKCASNLLETPYEEMLWEALQRKATRLKSLVSLHTAHPVQIDYNIDIDDLVRNYHRYIKDCYKDIPSCQNNLSAIPGRLDRICSLRGLESLHLSFGHAVDEPALVAIGNSLTNLVDFNCNLAEQGITIETMNCFFSKLKHLKEFRCNSDFEHVKSLLDMNHQLEVAGLEATLNYLPSVTFMSEIQMGHSANEWLKPIPLKHLVLKRRSMDREKIKMLPSVRHLMLVGWQGETELNDAVWESSLDFENLESLHLLRANTIYIKFLQKFGPELKELSLVNVTYYDLQELPLGQILRLCPKLETLAVVEGKNPIVQAGPLLLPPMKHLEKLFVVGNFCTMGQSLDSVIDLTDDLLVHLLSSPKLRECNMESVKFSKKAAVELEILARSGKIFQNLEYCKFNGGKDSNNRALAYLGAALSHAPYFQGSSNPARTPFNYYAS